MKTKSTEVSNKIKVLVFKDNFAAKTFEVPLSWISKTGILLGIILGTSVLCIFLAFRYYRIATRMDPTRIQDLEQNLADLKSQLKTAEANTKTCPASGVSTGIATPLPAKSTPKTSAFSLLPADSEMQPLPDPAQLSFLIQNPKINWKGNLLRVQFVLQYTREDKGSQQGTIILVARGAGRFFVYPAQAFGTGNSPFFIDPAQGESFSVSRFRKVKADFGPVLSRDALQKLEIFIFDKEEKILIHKEIELL
jgi:hypothetical protein